SVISFDQHRRNLNSLLNTDYFPRGKTVLFEIVNHGFFAEPPVAILHELRQQRIRLEGLVRFAVCEDDVEGDLVTLLDDLPWARYHFAGVKKSNSRNCFQKLVCGGD